MSLQFFTPAGVKSAGHKKQCDDGDENEVSHGGFGLQASWGSFSSCLECGGKRSATPLFHR
jgi:hypothetical protein